MKKPVSYLLHASLNVAQYTLPLWRTSFYNIIFSNFTKAYPMLVNVCPVFTMHDFSKFDLARFNRRTDMLKNKARLWKFQRLSRSYARYRCFQFSMGLEDPGMAHLWLIWVLSSVCYYKSSILCATSHFATSLKLGFGYIINTCKHHHYKCVILPIRDSWFRFIDSLCGSVFNFLSWSSITL